MDRALINSIIDEIDKINKDVLARNIPFKQISTEDAISIIERRNYSRTPDPTYWIEHKKRTKVFNRTGDASVFTEGINQDLTRWNLDVPWKILTKEQKLDRLSEYFDRRYPAMTTKERLIFYREPPAETIYKDGKIVAISEVDSFFSTK
jgi:hypothetical protein